MTQHLTRRPEDTDEFRVGEGRRDLTVYRVPPPPWPLPRPDVTGAVYLKEHVGRKWMVLPDQTVPIPVVEGHLVPGMHAVRPEFHQGRHRRPLPRWTLAFVATGAAMVAASVAVLIMLAVVR